MARVLHVISGLKVGGAEMMLHRLILSDLGGMHSHVVVALDPEGEMASRFREAGIPLLIFHFKRAPIRELWRLVTCIRALKPDIVQTWLYHADLIGGIAARVARVRCVIWGIRTTDVSKGGRRSATVVRWLCARLSRWVPNSIVCAAEASRRVHIELGYDAARMVVVANGFEFATWLADASTVSALRMSWGISSNDMVIGTLGRFSEVKDQRNFVRAAAILSRKLPAMKFLLVGRGCDDRNEQLGRWLVDAGLRERFVLLGERRDVAACLAAMDVFALPSRTEGFPNVLAEAMAMSRPCVTTDVGDAGYVLGDTGLVVPSEDPEALASALCTLAEMAPGERAALGAAARRRVEQMFSMPACAARFASVYEDVLKK